MLTLLEPFSEGMIDDDAALIRKYPSPKMEATPSCESNTSFDVADSERDLDAEAKKEKRICEKESQRSQTLERSPCVHAFPNGSES